jgi:hypothetical protein
MFPSIDTLLPAILHVFETGLEHTSWNAIQLLCYGCLNGQKVIVAITFIGHFSHGN